MKDEKENIEYDLGNGSACPRIYDKLLISSIMTSNMLCKVRVKVGL